MSQALQSKEHSFALVFKGQKIDHKFGTSQLVRALKMLIRDSHIHSFTVVQKDDMEYTQLDNCNRKTKGNIARYPTLIKLNQLIRIIYDGYFSELYSCMNSVSFILT